MKPIIRCKVRRVAELTGFSVEVIREMAARGELPSALQRKRGGKWTFDEAGIIRWIEEREAKPSESGIPTGGSKASRTSKSEFEAKNTARGSAPRMSLKQVVRDIYASKSRR